MQKVSSTLWQICLYTLGYLYATSNTALAQVTSDGTVNTQVNQNGNVAEITGGETRGDNLFHSFQDFSVSTGNEAAFLNANDIANIFSRVTGGNISNIDGLISANGSANLFLINPAGIIFGENARLSVGGSFYGSSADSILFENGEFSATDLNKPPVLTINAPIGLNFRDNPEGEDIVNRSIVENSSQELVGLEVLPGNNLAFIGGNIKFEGGKATASGGDITLGGLSEAGIVSINEDSSFGFPEDITKANITLSNGAYINAMGTGGGNIAVNARNLSLTKSEADIGLTGIQTGISSESTSAEAQGGDVIINVAEKLFLDNSGIFNQVYPEGVGNAGSITINTGSLEAINGGAIAANILGQGNIGVVDISATKNITLAENSGVYSTIFQNAVGNLDGMKISTNNLNLTDGSEIALSVSGKGNAGNITIKTGSLEAINGGKIVASTSGQGNVGDIKIATTNLNLTNGSSVDIDVLGQGNVGVIDITATENIQITRSYIESDVNSNAVGDTEGVRVYTNNLTLTNGGFIDAEIYGQGNVGKIDITATGDITLAGEDSDGFPSRIVSGVQSNNAVGNAEGIRISTNNLNFTNGGEIELNVSGRGNTGIVDITARGDITLAGKRSDGFPSRIIAQVLASGTSDTGEIITPRGVGDVRGVRISANNLTLTDGGQINASTYGEGDAGTVDITTTGNITISGDNLGPDGLSSGIFSTVDLEGLGDAGGIKISTTNLTLTNGGQIDASTYREGDGGRIVVNASESIALDGTSPDIQFPSAIFNSVQPGAVGNSGSIDLTTANLSISNGAAIFVGTSGNGDGGDLTFDISDRLTLEENSTISAQALGTNNSGGNITINAQDGFVVAFPNQNPGSGNDILANSPAGIDGNIEIYAQGVFGLTERDVLSGNNQLANNNTNDVDASGTISGSIPTIFIPREIQDLPPIVSAEQTTDSACQASSDGTARNGLVVNGKGGVSPAPDQPLASENIMNNNEIASESSQTKPIVTRLGKIQLARGITVTKDGRVILTPYATNNAGERMLEINPNCS